MNAKKPNSKPAWTDPDDAPALNESFFKNADLYQGKQLKARGRPKALVTKEPVKLRLDADLVAALRASGEGWQTRINETLRASMRLAGLVN